MIFASSGTSLLISIFLPDFANVNNDAIGQMASINPILMAVQVILLAPIAEECMYRGLLFIPFYRKKPSYGYLVSALAFCSIHVIGYIGLVPVQTILICWLQYIPSSLLLSRACAHTGSILTPMIAHSLINTISFLSMFYIA